jgi:hypothetical protein
MASRGGKKHEMLDQTLLITEDPFNVFNECCAPGSMVHYGEYNGKNGEQKIHVWP